MTAFSYKAGINGIKDVPNTIPTAAPKEAAEERPSVNGLTNGFPSRDCMTHPATARLMPVRIARIIRGRRKPRMTICSAEEGEELSGFVMAWSNISKIRSDGMA